MKESIMLLPSSFDRKLTSIMITFQQMAVLTNDRGLVY